MKNLNCVKFFPVNIFAAIMGLAGLAIAYERVSFVFHYELLKYASKVILFIALSLILVFLVLYLLKCFYKSDSVLKEFKHPVKINFFPSISISFLLLSIACLQDFREISFWFWVLGSVLQLVFALMIISRWVTCEYEIIHSNPAWFIPVVGNILVPIAGVEFANKEISWFFFSVGVFFWLALFTIVFYRIVFHHQMPQKFIPTLFILIAPPAVGFISYMKLTESNFDAFARFLFFLALFFTLLLFFMVRYFWNIKFFISWWAYTFPLCAITIATTLAYKVLQLDFFVCLIHIFLLLATFFVLLVFFKTLVLLKRGQLCVEEE